MGQFMIHHQIALGRDKVYPILLFSFSCRRLPGTIAYTSMTIELLFQSFKVTVMFFCEAVSMALSSFLQSLQHHFKCYIVRVYPNYIAFEVVFKNSDDSPISDKYNNYGTMGFYCIFQRIMGQLGPQNRFLHTPKPWAIFLYDVTLPYLVIKGQKRVKIFKFWRCT